MAEITQCLRPVLFDVKSFQRFELRACFRRERYHAPDVCPDAPGDWSDDASSCSAEARRRSNTGSKGIVSPAAIRALLRVRLSNHPRGAGVVFAELDMG